MYMAHCLLGFGWLWQIKPRSCTWLESLCLLGLVCCGGQSSGCVHALRFHWVHHLLGLVVCGRQNPGHDVHGDSIGFTAFWTWLVVVDKAQVMYMPGDSIGLGIGCRA